MEMKTCQMRRYMLSECGVFHFIAVQNSVLNTLVCNRSLKSGPDAHSKMGHPHGIANI